MKKKKKNKIAIKDWNNSFEQYGIAIPNVMLYNKKEKVFLMFFFQLYFLSYFLKLNVFTKDKHNAKTSHNLSLIKTNLQRRVLNFT